MELADRVDTYICTVVSPKIVEIVQSKQTEGTPKRLRVKVLDAASLPHGQHDVILTLNVLHLLPELEDVLSQIYNALPLGGLLIAEKGLLKDGYWFIPLIIPFMRAIGKATYVRNLSDPALLDMPSMVMSPSYHSGFTRLIPHGICAPESLKAQTT